MLLTHQISCHHMIHKLIFICIILYYKNLKFKHLTDDIVLDFWFFGYLTSIKNIRRKYNLMVDLLKFISNKNILSKVVVKFVIEIISYIYVLHLSLSLSHILWLSFQLSNNFVWCCEKIASRIYIYIYIFFFLLDGVKNISHYFCFVKKSLLLDQMKTTDIYRPQKNKGKLEQQMINEFYPLLFSIYKSRLITNGLNLDSISAIYRNTRSQKYNILFLRIYLKG